MSLPLTIPLALTLLRLVLVPVFLALLFFPAAHSAAIRVAAVMAVTDFLDGHLARRWHQTSRLGLYLDPLADKLLVASTFVLFAFPRVAPAGMAIPWPLVVGVYTKDLGVIAGALWIRFWLGRVEIRPNLSGKISTATQIALILATLLASDLMRLSTELAAGVIWSLWWLTLLTATAAGMSYAWEGARQLRAGLPSELLFRSRNARSNAVRET